VTKSKNPHKIYALLLTYYVVETIIKPSQLTIALKQRIMNMFKVLGITDEKNVCECCGKINLKCTVALDSDSDTGIVYYGRDCAAKAIYGNKKSSAVKTVESLAMAIEYAKKWLPTRSAVLVANAIRVRFCDCSAIGDAVVFSNGVKVTP